MIGLMLFFSVLGEGEAEKKLNLIEEKLFKIIEEAKILGLKSNEFIDLVKILYQEEDKK